MLPPLVPCPRCARHVRAGDTRCPFCDESHGPSRATLALAATLAIAACRTSSTSHVDTSIVQPYGAPPTPRPPDAQEPVRWELSASATTLPMSQRASWRLSIAATNRGAIPADPARHALSFSVNGVSSVAANLAFGNGAMEPAWSMLPAGATVRDARELGASLFEAPGEYEIVMLYGGRPVASVHVSVVADGLTAAQ